MRDLMYKGREINRSQRLKGREDRLVGRVVDMEEARQRVVGRSKKIRERAHMKTKTGWAKLM